MSLIHSFNDTDFFFRQAVEFIDAAVYLVVGSGNLGFQLLAGIGILVEIVFPLVLLREREFYLLLQLCCSRTTPIKSDRHMIFSWNSGRNKDILSLGTTSVKCSSFIS